MENMLFFDWILIGAVICRMELTFNSQQSNRLFDVIPYSSKPDVVYSVNGPNA